MKICISMDVVRDDGAQLSYHKSVEVSHYSDSAPPHRVAGKLVQEALVALQLVSSRTPLEEYGKSLFAREELP